MVVADVVKMIREQVAGNNVVAKSLEWQSDNMLCELAGVPANAFD